MCVLGLAALSRSVGGGENLSAAQYQMVLALLTQPRQEFEMQYKAY